LQVNEFVSALVVADDEHGIGIQSGGGDAVECRSIVEGEGDEGAEVVAEAKSALGELVVVCEVAGSE
jgi:hypothetical protein